MNQQSLPKRLRWFQLRIRDILAITVICALVVGWWNDRHHLITFAERSADALRNDLAQQRSLTEQLRKLVADANLRPVDTIGCSFPAPVQGLVTVSRPEEGLVEINIGGDDGLKLGDRLHVYRWGATLDCTKYLGQIILTQVDTTNSVGTLRRETMRGTIEKGDHVATHLE